MARKSGGPEDRNEIRAKKALIDALVRKELVSPGILETMLRDYAFSARPKQRIPDPEPRILCIQAGRGWGKLLDLETLIPTSQGFVRLGDLRAGATVFDEQGQPCSVRAVYEDFPERAWRLHFSDGTSLVAGGEHLWQTWTHAARKAANRTQNPQIHPEVRSTDEIVRTLTYGKRGDLNHSISLTKPLRLRAKSLPIEPYLLGWWLGDGTSTDAEITVGEQDQTFFALRFVGKWRTPKNRVALFRVVGLFRKLRVLGLLGNKHVPEKYLWASEAQRLALLRGLMDSDGCASTSHVEFCNTNETLARAVLHLARSLGEKPRLRKGTATLRGVECGPKYRVVWRPVQHNPFLLPRKADRVLPLGRQASRNQHRMIIAVESVPLRPMRCLAVDSPSHLFLAGEALIPTHNTWTGAHWCRQQIEDRQCKQLLAVGPTATDVHDIMVPMLLEVLPEAKYRRAMDAPTVIYQGATIHLRSGQRVDRVRGLNIGAVWADEIDSWRPELHEPKDAWLAVIEPACRLHPAKFLITSTPKRGGLVAWFNTRADVQVVRGHTRENEENLAPGVVEALIAAYAGSWLEQQELGGEIVEEIKGALVTRAMIDATRVAEAPDLLRIVIGVDPSGGADEQGIVVVGVDARKHYYVLRDASAKRTPDGWGRKVVELYDEYDADKIVAEKNCGGDMVRSTIQTVRKDLPVKMVTATRGKHIRFEPVAALYEQGRIHHVGAFSALENQVTAFTVKGYEAGGSPNNCDAMVWACAELMQRRGPSPTELYGPGGLMWQS